ncbi:MAG: MiaB/RimO family radical SAM methylthiotransferase [Holophagales bacterium]|nr:MiaB/RimO family radical SAM methylthiotransferase [Holophagales bacterium]
MGLSTTFTGADQLSGRSSRAYDVRVLGCKVSQIEAGHLARVLEASGLSRVRPGEPADVLVLHACTVTERADRDALRLMRRLRREHPAALLAVTGCLAERDPDGLARRPEVDLVAGHGSSAALVRLVEEVRAGLLPGKVAAPGVSPDEVLRSPLAWTTGPGRTRAFLKVQDGCGRRCAFCIVPSLRGSERSAPSAEVEEAVRVLGAQGVPEVVLCGVHLAAFGSDRGESLVALLERLESRPPGCRVRLSSLEPMEAGEALVDLVAAGSVVVPHLHLPLQSGSDAVLRRMRRGMTTVRFRTLLDRAWRGNPRFHLATDVIAGFPGETDAEFSETEALLRDLPLASLHVFPFSPRSGTPAAALAATDGVPRAVVTRRAARLRDLDSTIRRSFARSHAGRHADLVSLSGGVGLTETYVEAALSAGCPRPGSRFRARLALLSDGTLAAHPESRPPDRLQGS